MKHLARIESDHSPLLVEFSTTVKHKSRFLFQRIWADHQELKSIIENTWQSISYGSPGYVFSSKLGAVRKVLTQWNWQNFGNVQNNIQKIQSEIDRLEFEIQQSWADQRFAQCQILKDELRKNLQFICLIRKKG